MSPLRRSQALPGVAVPCVLLLACALLAALAVPAALAQDREQEAESAEDDWRPLESFDEAISVEVTNIEVWVTDRRGNPVTGLAADDFVLTEDGEPVEITNFASYTAEESGSWSAADATMGAPAEPAPVALPVAQIDPDQRLHLAILVDNWNLRPADRARVFEDLRDFLRERMSPRDRAMVLVHDRSLAMVQELTDDPDELMGALARVERSPTSNVQMETERRSAYRNIRDEYENIPPLPGLDPDPCVEAWEPMRNFAHQYATAVAAHTQRSGGALASAGGLLAGLPGRRVLLYVGSGLPQQAGSELFHFMVDLCPQQQSEVSTWYSQFDLTWLYEEVARQANANGLTLYTVEATVPDATGDISLPSLSGGMSDNAGGSRFIEIAGQTFRPTAASARSAELDSEAGLFYVANETGGRAILNAADFSKDFDRLATELRTYYSLGFAPDHGGDGRRVPIRVWVPLDEMTLVAPGGGGRADPRAGRLRVMMAVSDAAGNLGPVRQRVVDVEVGGQEAAGSTASGGAHEHLVEVDLDLPTTDHVVALGVRDELGGETSFVRHEIRLDTETMARIEMEEE